MNIKDLMVGDWVQNDLGEIQQVSELQERGAMLFYNDIYPYEDIEAIPLSAEILGKCGFEKRANYEIYAILRDEYEIRFFPKQNTVRFILMDAYNDYVEHEFAMPCKFLHELQHATTMCGIDIHFRP